jgi:hypothetical protein
MPGVVCYDMAMIDHVGMREAGSGMRSMAEGKNRWRRDEAKRCKRC